MYDALRDSLPNITERQRQVIELIAAGCSNDEVGERLGEAGERQGKLR